MKRALRAREARAQKKYGPKRKKEESLKGAHGKGKGQARQRQRSERGRQRNTRQRQRPGKGQRPSAKGGATENEFRAPEPEITKAEKAKPRQGGAKAWKAALKIITSAQPRRQRTSKAALKVPLATQREANRTRQAKAKARQGRAKGEALRGGIVGIDWQTIPTFPPRWLRTTALSYTNPPKMSGIKGFRRHFGEQSPSAKGAQGNC